MTITAKIIADSVSPSLIRLTTMQLRYPRFIHAELMTHRVFSRNASSSRAIPVERMIAELRRDPAMPVYWGAEQKGMQAGAELTNNQGALESVKWHWLNAMEQAIRTAEVMMERGLHKQIANRILEPWAHINVIVTATDWDNFYALRRHKDAQPEIKVLADAMWREQQASTAELLQPGEWHLPYVDGYAEGMSMPLSTPEQVELARKVSVARCARVSYLTHDGKEPTIEADLALYDRLVGSVPLHASPAEHQATPDTFSEDEAMGRDRGWDNSGEHGNLRGWRQFRKMIEKRL